MAELLLHGVRFDVASIGPETITLRRAQRAEPGKGINHMHIDGRVTVYHVDLFQGIDPEKSKQACRVVRQSDESAA